jgi:hypothetical protein
MDAKKLPTRLRMRGQVFGRNVEGAGGEGLLDGNIETADPGAMAANGGDKLGAGPQSPSAR